MTSLSSTMSPTIPAASDGMAGDMSDYAPSPSAAKATSDDSASAAWPTTASPRALAFDPRVKLAAFIVVNVAVTSARSLAPAIAAGIVTLALLAASRMWRTIMRYTTICAVCLTIWELLPLAVHATWAALVCLGAYWFLRFAALLGFMAFLIGTTEPSQLMAALVWVRMPRCVVIPLTVVFRFFPVVGAEFAAIGDAMRLRGIAPTAWSMLAHPVRCAEYIVVPLLASSSRMADDLSASGLLRGLGATPHPTCVVPLRCGWPDAALAVAMAAVVAVIPLSSAFGW